MAIFLKSEFFMMNVDKSLHAKIFRGTKTYIYLLCHSSLAVVTHVSNESDSKYQLRILQPGVMFLFWS